MQRSHLVNFVLTTLITASACGGRSAGDDEARDSINSAGDASADDDDDDSTSSDDRNDDADDDAADDMGSDDEPSDDDDIAADDDDGEDTDDDLAADDDDDDGDDDGPVVTDDADDAVDPNADDVPDDAIDDAVVVDDVMGPFDDDLAVDDDDLADDDTSTDDDPQVDPDAPLWLFAQSPERGIVNVNNPEQTIGDIGTLYEPTAASYPWSADGRWLADVREGGLVLYDLTQGGATTTIENDDFQQVLRWVDNNRLLVRQALEDGQGVALVDVSGDSVLVFDGSGGSVATHSVSPDGRIFAFGTSGNGEFPLFSVDLDALSEPVLVETYPMSPPIYPLWSPDSNWLAFGVSGEESMVMLWHPGSDPIRATAEGTGFAPLFTFAPDSSVFLSFGSTGPAAVLAANTLTSTQASAPVPLSEAEGQSPADWSPSGQFIVYSDNDSASLREYDFAGGFGPAIDVPGFRYSCPMYWLGPTQFVYHSCSESGDGSYYIADVVGESLEVVMLPDATLPLLTGTDNCLINYGPDGISVGTIDGEFTPITPLQTPVSHLVTVPDGIGFAWVSLDSLLLWQPLDGCVPDGAPRAVGRRGGVVQAIDFVPQ